MPLADPSFRVGTRGIKIEQNNGSNAAIAIQVLQRSRSTISLLRPYGLIGNSRMALTHRHGNGNTVGGAAQRKKDDLIDAGSLRGQ